MAAIGILIFEGVEELDFVGPWEVFTAAAHLARDGSDSVRLIAATDGPVRCAKGMRVLPDCGLAESEFDVLVVPGGIGTRSAANNQALLAWLAATAAKCQWVSSVCTGALLLHACGVARGRRVTTHHSFVETLRARGEVTVLEGVRFVRDGNVVTAAGVSAGIDMALWIVGQLRDPAFAREVQRYIEYHPAPPYSAEL
ncbi:DJ-1/PfpI family protein [Nannocystis sp.]|uniref:DJ-1/PfpI family protein n=1 Tax=Nannocystis sp. TaxID=1962667 RepID=UPI002423C6F2|nr:DJ-1/PfpI family protein [Nannocystis sp.]MBK7823892.1 DJ-1/PfpI family protein [Nannocystis sp.]MBK9754902.1 DJ-1/PfpI family protein [Nannocystis sp.]